jgi:hypothetical protein
MEVFVDRVENSFKLLVKALYTQILRACAQILRPPEYPARKPEYPDVQKQ